MLKFCTLKDGIEKSSKTNALRDALEVEGKAYNYQQIYNESTLIATKIQELNQKFSQFIAVFGYRSKNAYVGILGVLLSGHAYMPMNPRFPAQRLKQMLLLSGCKFVVLGCECARSFVDCAKELSSLIVICLGDYSYFSDLITTMPQHEFVFLEGDNGGAGGVEVNVIPSNPAYLLFTSGSTGEPKGVVVSHGNVCSYLRYVMKRYAVTYEDRVSQMFDLTFDLSVHDIFVSFLSGACLCVVPEKSLMGPAKFIKDKKLTCWFSVPAVVMFMEKMGMLKPDSFPSLRYSLFCGEALPGKCARMWQIAAPNSIIENLYGPTETTIAVSGYRWDGQRSLAECINGVVPIGWIFNDLKVKIINCDNKEVEVGEVGQLCIAGSQVTSGYLNNLDQTKLNYVYFDDVFWYKTGDLVKQDRRGCLYYLGRIDEQIKIRGYRVELQEIDSVLRRAANTNLAACVAFRREDDDVFWICAFVQGEDNEELGKKIVKECADYLPEYMIPAKICFIESMPLNVNGKIDRKKLKEYL